MVTWPPSTHDDVSAQAYAAGGGNYYRSSQYYLGARVNSINAAALTLNMLCTRPFFVPVRTTFNSIGLSVSVAATAGGVLRFGIYGNTSGLPDALILDAGTVASTATGFAAITISQTLDPGLYWVAAAAQTATCTVRATDVGSVSMYFAYPTFSPTNPGDTYVKASVTGALPSSFAATTSTGDRPAIALRAA